MLGWMRPASREQYERVIAAIGGVQFLVMAAIDVSALLSFVWLVASGAGLWTIGSAIVAWLAGGIGATWVACLVRSRVADNFYRVLRGTK